jgi:hypothetical protein
MVVIIEGTTLHLKSIAKQIKPGLTLIASDPVPDCILALCSGLMNAFPLLRKRERLLYVSSLSEGEARTSLISCSLPLTAQAEIVTATTSEEIEHATQEAQYTTAVVHLPEKGLSEEVAVRLSGASAPNHKRIVLIAPGKSQAAASQLFANPCVGMYAESRDLAPLAASVGYLLCQRGGTWTRHQSGKGSWLVLKHQGDTPRVIGIPDFSGAFAESGGEQSRPKPEPNSFFTKVAGVSHQNADGSDRQRIIRGCSRGDVVRFVREPDNAHDHRAVKVLTENGGQIGYLGANIVGNDQGIGWCVAKEMDKGRVYHGEIANITGQGTDTLGVNLKVSFGDGTVDETADLPIPEVSRGSNRRVRATAEASKSGGCLMLMVLTCVGLLTAAGAVVLIGAL